jgi:hypothetical protein
MRKIIGFLLLLTACAYANSCFAQGTVTAASCSRTDVNAIINGPTHTAVNGDKIVIPGTSCTWTSGISISGVGIAITGTGTPNTGGGTVGAGTSNTTLIDNAGGALFNFSGLAFGQTAKVELLTMSGSGAGSFTINAPIIFSGSCTASGCANIRVDNITFSSNTWETPLTGGFIILENVLGVVDHNSATESPSSAPTLTQINHPSWQGVGQYGDNSFASADTFGTAQAIYVENNSLNGVRGSEDDVSIGDENTVGGPRYVCRFNTVVNMSGTGLCSAHGTAWTGRPRGQRQVEVYYNTVQANPGCDAIDGLNSGTGYYLSNALTVPGAGCNKFVNLDIARFAGLTNPVWANCDGTEPFDQSPFSSTSQCIDQPGRGIGLLLQGGTDSSAVGMTQVSTGNSCNGTPIGTCFPNPALDPVYEAGETLAAPGSFPNPPVVVPSDGSSTRVLANRDYYMEVAMTAQTSATSPFNGTSGTGFGTLARRPTTCTPAVGYWATDQGLWNTFNSQQGILYVCTSTNTWTAKYTPYTYPHPLTTGVGSVTLSPSSESYGMFNLGASSSPATFTLTNSSGTTATSISITDTDTTEFPITNSGAGSCSSGSLAASASCTFTVVFSPTSAGTKTPTLSVSYSGGDGASPQTVVLSGTGVSATAPAVAIFGMLR